MRATPDRARTVEVALKVLTHNIMLIAAILLGFSTEPEVTRK